MHEEPSKRETEVETVEESRQGAEQAAKKGDEVAATKQDDEFNGQADLRSNGATSGEGGCVRKTENSRKKQSFKDSKDCEAASKSPPGCSKFCKGIKDDSDSQIYKFTVCTSAKQNRLAYRMKRSKRRIEEISYQVKIRTKKSVKMLKNLCKSISAKRAIGFRCNLRKCNSTLMECGKTCSKPDMLFSAAGKEKAENCHGEKHHAETETVANQSAAIETNRTDKSIVTVEEKETNT
ncbi:uncharacterized protein LOC117221646 [Megalopta genalis]|uniref:uncharacterized protein LOC117221646 n=1 Tax=Megalopta genalis TaxID=115081 RepID=UPI003FCF64B1